MSLRKTLLQVIGTGRSVKLGILTPDFHTNQPSSQRNPICSLSLNFLVCKTGTKTILPSPSLRYCMNNEANRCKNISYSSTTIKNTAIVIINSSKKLKHCKNYLECVQNLRITPPTPIARFPVALLSY